MNTFNEHTQHHTEVRPEPTTTNRSTGQQGEDVAVIYLQSLGYRIIERNWRIARGELDIIAQDNQTIVAIEVKTRRGQGYGAPLEAITYLKTRRLRRLLFEWVRNAQPNSKQLRIDGIGITLRPAESPLIEHVEGIG